MNFTRGHFQTVGGGSGDTGVSTTTDQQGRFVIKLPVYESKEKQVLSLVLCKTHRLSDYRGRVVVLDFWGVWCSGCITSIPMIQELEAKYESQGVVFLGIHTADGELDQINDLKKLHNWKTVTGIDQGKEINDGETASRYAVSGYSTFMVIDGTGKISFNSSIPPASQDEFMKEMQQFAKALNIPWPPSEKEDKETIAQMNRIFAAKIGQEIDKALAAPKSAK